MGNKKSRELNDNEISSASRISRHASSSRASEIVNDQYDNIDVIFDVSYLCMLYLTKTYVSFMIHAIFTLETERKRRYCILVKNTSNIHQYPTLVTSKYVSMLPNLRLHLVKM